MKKLLVIVLCFFLLCGMKLLLPTEWKIVKEKAIVKYKLASDSGCFKGIETKLNFDLAELPKSTIVATVDVNSISSGDDGKNEHLKSEEFFDAAKFPKITFTSTKIAGNKNQYERFLITGKLKIKKVEKLISFPFAFNETDSGGVFSGSFEIFAGDFGVMKKSKSGADKVKIAIVIPVTK
ncbi:MAG: YceI family protein [Bacteroidia bacterium]|nr:YceI family protein [Bacteroidia bacterium]